MRKQTLRIAAPAVDDQTARVVDDKQPGDRKDIWCCFAENFHCWKSENQRRKLLTNQRKTVEPDSLPQAAEINQRAELLLKKWTAQQK